MNFDIDSYIKKKRQWIREQEMRESVRHSLTNLDPDYVEQIVNQGIDRKKNNLKKGRGYFEQQINPVL